MWLTRWHGARRMPMHGWLIVFGLFNTSWNAPSWNVASVHGAEKAERSEAVREDGPSADGPSADGPSYEQKIRPILKQHCYQCHGEETEAKGGLDLRLVRLMKQGGETGPAVIPYDADQSLLWQRVRADEMPPGVKKLSLQEKELLQAWIQSGAPTAREEPANPADARFTTEELQHWAFQPIAKSTIPTPICSHESVLDHFIVKRLFDSGLAPSALADRATLLRRLSLDLLGVPPTPEELRDWVNDERPNAWEHLVDRLLSSPQYGIRWGRHWLDIAGYAESDGNAGTDHLRPHAWHYRDYVIAAFNSDKPFDQFILEQLAGDELLQEQGAVDRTRQLELLSATGFLRMAPDITESDNSLIDRNQAVADTLKIVGSAVLGVTIGCAQCHDHRYEPISIEDYYQWRAVFDPAFSLQEWKRPSERLVDLTDDVTKQKIEQIEAEAVRIENDIRQRRREYCQQIQARLIEESPAEFQTLLRTAIDTPPESQTEEQKKLLDRFPMVKTVDWIIGQLIEYDMPAYRGFEAEEKKVTELRETKPLPCLVMTVSEPAKAPAPSAVLFRGDPAQPQRHVVPADIYVARQHRDTSDLGLKLANVATSGRRLAYARQLTDGRHPLVARVWVNRVWMHHFGRGIVATPGDFGIAGEPPTHPELLDWLAHDFMQHGWSTKWLHRRMLLSATYQQAAQRTTRQDEVDPQNRLWGRANLRRCEAEVVRDSLLAVSGRLNNALGGPSVPVDLDGEGKVVVGKRALRDGLFSRIESASGQDARCSIYISTRRGLALNVLDTFDLPAMNPNCVQRAASTTAPQALWCLNDGFMIECADHLAESLWWQHRTQRSEGNGPMVRELFLRLFAVPPTAEEQQRCETFLAAQVPLFAENQDAEWQKQVAQNPELVTLRAWSSLCHMLMASNRFVYVD